MNAHLHDVPVRTLFVDRGIFHSSEKRDNGMFPWEDVEYTAGRILETLTENGFIHSKSELIRVRFTRRLADLVGGKRSARHILTNAFRLMKDVNPELPDFLDVEIYAAQK